MSGTPHPQKTLHARLAAVFVTLLFLVSLFPVGSGQAGITQEVTLASTTASGDGAIVGFQITQDAGKALTLPTGITAKKIASGGGKDRYTGEVAFVSSAAKAPPGASPIVVGASEKTKTVTFASTGAAKTLSWTRTSDLQITGPTGLADRTFWGTAAANITVKDSDIADCQAANLPTILHLVGHEWVPFALDQDDCTKMAADTFRYNLTLPAAHTFTSGERVILGVLDAAAANGEPTVRHATYAFRSAAGPIVSILREDLTAIAGDIPSGDYVLHVRDGRADVRGNLENKPSGALDTVKVKVTSNVHTQPLTFTLTETGPDTGTFTKKIRIATTTGSDTVLVSGSTSPITAKYGGATDATATWRSITAPVITVTPSSNIVYEDTLTVSVSDPHQSTATRDIVVRTTDVYTKECSAGAFTLAQQTAAESPSCATLTISGTGTVKLVPPGGDLAGACTGIDPCAAILVKDNSLITVEYRDAVTPDGKKDQPVSSASSSRIWKMAFKGSISLDREAYYVGETMTVRLVDPDQTAGTTRTVTLSKGGISRELTLTGGSGLFTGTITIGSGAGQFPATNGETISAAYVDSLSPSGDPDPATTLVIEQPTGRATSDKDGIAGKASFKLTLSDSNLGATQVPPYATAASLFGSHSDTLHFKPGSGGVQEATVTSAYATKTITKTPTLRGPVSSGGPFGTLTCWYEIDLGEPFEPYGLSMKNNNPWTHKKTGDLGGQSSARTFQADFRNGLIIIDAAEPLPTQPCSGRGDVSNLQVTYTPAATLVEHFIFDDVTNQVPLGKHLTTPTFVGGATGWGAEELTHATFGDARPSQDGSISEAKEVLFWKGSESGTGADANKCSYIKIEPATIGCSTVDLLAGIVTVSPTPAPGTVLRVEYRASGTMTDATGPTLSHKPVLAGSVRDSTGTLVVPQNSVDLRNLVDAGTLPGGTSCPCTYRTDLFHDNALDYGSGIDFESGKHMVIQYVDLVGKDGPQNVPLGVSLAKAGTAAVRLLDDQGFTSRFVFGTSSTPSIELVFPQGDLDSSGFDTVSVSVSSIPVSRTGLGTLLETETITLTETELNSGVFRAPLRLETAASAGNDVLHVGSHDSVRLEVSHAASGKSTHAWYYRTNAATLTVGASEFFGSESLVVSVTDADKGTRYVDVRRAGATEDTPFRVKDLVPAINAIETSTVVVYACKGTDCRILRLVDGSPASPMPKDDDRLIPGNFRVDSAGNIRHTNPTGFVPDFIRVDFRAVRSDTAVVVPLVIHPDGSSDIMPAVTLSETGAATNTFTRSISATSLGLTDDATVRFVYRDRAYEQIGTGCTPPAEDCPGIIERAPGRADVLIRDVAWRPAGTGVLTATWSGMALSPTHTVVHGSDVVRLRLVDDDRDTDPAVADSVSVDLLRGGAVATSVVLHETDRDTGIFLADVSLNGWTSGTTWDVRYSDPTGPAGNPFSTRLSDPAAISSSKMLWRPADIATLSVQPGRIPATGGAIDVVLADTDRDTSGSGAQSVPTDRFFIAQTPHADEADAEAVTLGPLIETGAATARFTGTWSFGTDLDPGTRYFVIYKDPSDLVNRTNRVVASFETLPADVNIPAFGASSYESGSSLITLNVAGLATNDPRKVDIWYRSPTATTWSLGTPTLDLSGSGATSFTLVSTTGVTHLKAAGGGSVPLNSELLAVYHDDAPGIGRAQTVIGSGAAQPVSQAMVASGQKGNDDWYVTQPTVAFSAKENANRLGGFQYRLNGGSTQSCTDLPCSLSIGTEGSNILEYRALDLAGTPEQFAEGKQFNELIVRFDATAPTANVSALATKSGPGGTIELSWAGLPAGTPETQFAQYLVFRGSNSTPIGNTEQSSFVDSSLTTEGEFSYWVAVEDAAGHRGPMAGPVTGISDSTPPAVAKVGVSRDIVVEGQDVLRVDLFILLDGTRPSDFDQARVVVTPPAGGGGTQEIVLSASGLNHTGSFTNFNVSGLYSFSFQALDQVGNFQPFTETVRFKAIDRTAPVVSVPATVEQGKTLEVTVEDNDAGIRTVVYTVDGGAQQTVSVSGSPLEHKFTIPTAGLTVGQHSIVLTVTDDNGTAADHRNTATYTRTFEVLPPGSDGDGDDGGDGEDPPTGSQPLVELVSSLVEEAGSFRVRVTAQTLTALTVSFDGGAAQGVRASWQASGTPVAVSIGSLAAGEEHTARVVATNAAGVTTADFTFFVLDAGVPLPPETVVVQETDEGKPRVTWTASSSSNLGGYLVHRASSPSKVIAVLGSDATAFTDGSAKDGTTYTYAVTAYGANGEGKLEEGADSTALAWFGHVKATSFEVEAQEPGIGGFWWVFLILAVVIVGIAMVYVYRERLFGGRKDEEYDDEYPDEAASPFGVERHHLRCPNCTHEFSVSGQKPIVTTCPECGKKGILR